jgi:hypothetical protein
MQHNHMLTRLCKFLLHLLLVLDCSSGSRMFSATAAQLR